MDKTIEERVRQVVIEHLDADPDKVTKTANLFDDLGADSLDGVEIVMAMEEEFDVEIPDDEIDDFKTVGELIVYMEGKLKLTA